MHRAYWKSLVILAVALLAAWTLFPSFSFYRQPRTQQEEMRQRRNPLVNKILNLGLDLQGGSHLLLELQTAKLPDDRMETVNEAMDRAIEVIRNRIDQYGLSEPLIVRQGQKWIVVQLPGVKDRNQAKDLIGRTALLEFRLVDSAPLPDGLINKARELNLGPLNLRPGQMPKEIKSLLLAGMELLPGKESAFYVVKTTAEMTGAGLKNARVEMGSDYSGAAPHVALEFNDEGTKLFAAVTGANVGRNLAIVLDGTVMSAPVIRSSIPDGRAIIEGQFTPEDAKFLKSVLQAGALPAPLEIVEERTVGATLGDDSIRAGLAAGALGLAIIFLFMAVYYKWSGVLANLALVLNLVLLLALMAMFKATLTMPGIAGIILTIGMAVDANVLILERIREEIRLGKTPRLAVDQGYEKAFSAIFDGNLTTIIAAVFLFQFGTGPVKGFGISLMLGLTVSMFTAIVVTRTAYDLLLLNRNVQKL
ncbi:MAG: protein translocase subunit SecD, partial [Elusimicrobia bacterium]|nr:protein translocase subunit SecD [Elusimicrobiota bacterium]